MSSFFYISGNYNLNKKIENSWEIEFLYLKIVRCWKKIKNLQHKKTDVQSAF